MEITEDKTYRTISFSHWDNTTGTMVTDKEPAAIQIPTYSFNGISGLSLTQVAMMVTVNRANQVENEIIKSMEEIAEINKQLDIASQLADVLSKVGIDETIPAKDPTTSVTFYDGFNDDGTPKKITWTLHHAYWMLTGKYTDPETIDYDEAQEYYQVLTREMDSMNSLNQENMINLQSFVNKRDQAYELGSNIDKLMFSGYMTVARSL